MKRKTTFGLIAAIFLNLTFSNAQTSVLATGEWYKFRITTPGINKITYDLLKDAGVNVNSVNPALIRVYGNGGGMLPQPNDAFRHEDLVENDVLVVGGEDGSFDKGDYILFWAEGADATYYDAGSSQFRHQKNVYDNFNYYFLTIGPAAGSRVQGQPQAAGPLQTITTFDHHIYHEADQHTIIQSGREFYGEKFDHQLSRNFSYNVPQLVPSSTIRLTVDVMSGSCSGSQFTTALNNNNLGTISLGAATCEDFGPKGIAGTGVYTLAASALGGNTTLNLRVTYNKQGDLDAFGHLNFFDMTVQRQLRLYNNQTVFRSAASTTQPVSEFVVTHMTPDAVIWDVTDPLHPKQQDFVLTGEEARLVVETDTLKTFVAFRGAGFPQPRFETKVSNQNLRGITTAPELLIVAHKTLWNAANQLAAFRTAHDGITTQVVTTEQVYNEFSSGRVDVTAIRDFAKMLYDQSAGDDSLRYLLLFGKASYDYKGIVAPNSTMLVPVYQSRESLNNLQSYASDDYYGFLEDSEGNWDEMPSPVNHTLDIGVGRLPVKNAPEAEAMVKKIKHYSTSSDTYGNWRNKFLFVADDGDFNIHMNDADKLATLVDTTHKQYIIQKVYLDAYPQVPAPDRETSPAATQAIHDLVHKGVFMLNYTGHGNELRLADEDLINVDRLKEWTNIDRLPVFVTATCSFGRNDFPGLISGAEEALLSSKGGCIALLTTTRVVFASTNFIINEAFYEHAFGEPGDTIRPRLGDIIRITKNESVSGVNNRNFSLLGDPSLRLNYPEKDIRLTQFKEEPIVAGTPDTLKALDKVTLEGEISNHNGSLASNFNGTLQIVVFDKATEKSTSGSAGPIMNFTERKSILFNGKATVINGAFSVTFVVPKDISFQYEEAKISLYARNIANTMDAGSGSLHFLVGGVSDSAGVDNTPPVIELFMDDETFVFGGTTGRKPVLIANLSDESGINTSGYGVGKEITATLSEQPEKIGLNKFYVAAQDNFQEGRVEYQLNELEPGRHSIKLKAWDTHNNSSEEYLEFIVAEDEELALNNVLNYPNPFSTHTTFHFDHNRAGDNLQVMVEIYTISGRLIKTLITQSFSGTAHFSDLTWDGRDDFGSKLGKGVYVYKVSIRSTSDGSKADKYQKLVILN